MYIDFVEFCDDEPLDAAEVSSDGTVVATDVASLVVEEEAVWEVVEVVVFVSFASVAVVADTLVGPLSVAVVVALGSSF